MYSNERMVENFGQRKLFENIQCLNEDGETYVCEYKNESSPFSFWDVEAWAANAMYIPTSNVMVLCAGFLQDVIFKQLTQK